jgi:hypothetical protein
MGKSSQITGRNESSQKQSRVLRLARMENLINEYKKSQSENLRQRNRLGDPGIDGRITLKQFLDKLSKVVGLSSSVLL